MKNETSKWYENDLWRHEIQQKPEFEKCAFEENLLVLRIFNLLKTYRCHACHWPSSHR